MIHSVTVINPIGESMEMVLTHPEKSGFNIYNIEGLGPNAFSVSVTNLASGGAVVNSAVPQARNIVLSIKFIGTPLIEDTRRMSYRLFPVGLVITLIIKTDHGQYEIKGIVESNTPVIFEQQEFTQISLICPDYYFNELGDKGYQVTEFSTVEPKFQFPFSNESLIDPLIEFSDLVRDTSKTISYRGSGNPGIILTATFLEAVSISSNYGDIVITRESDILGSQTMTIHIDSRLPSIIGVSGFAGGDRLVLNTEQYSFMWYRPNSATYPYGRNILPILTDRSGSNDVGQWFYLSFGSNLFNITVPNAYKNFIDFKIENKILYEGV